MLVYIGNDSVVKFKEFSDVIYSFNTSSHENPTNNRVSNYYFLSAVAYKKHTLRTNKLKYRIDNDIYSKP